MTKPTRRLALLAILGGFLLAFLMESSLLPDSCVTGADHDCCEATAATTSCNSLCCGGIQGTPEPAFDLRCTDASLVTWTRTIPQPESLTREPLVRPPISA